MNSATNQLEFDRCNLNELSLKSVIAHEGIGKIHFSRIATASSISGACNFIDFSVLPPGTAIGTHRHRPSEEEYYLVLSGAGIMKRDEFEFRVIAGDLVRNPPGASHSLVNDGNEDLKLFVFELKVV